MNRSPARDDMEMRKSRSPATRQSSPTPSRVLDVIGLNPNTKESDLEQLFNFYGKVEKIAIQMDGNVPRGVVTFEDVEDAMTARDGLNNTEVHSRPIRVEFSSFLGNTQPSKRTNNSEDRSRSPAKREVEMRRSRSPPVRDVEMRRSRSPPARRREASRSRDDYRSSRDDRPRGDDRPPRHERVIVDRSRNTVPPPSRVLGVFGLSLKTTEEDLDRIFSIYGKLEKVTIVIDSYTRASRGFGFVTFDNIEDATTARDGTNGSEVHSRQIRVDYSLTPGAHKSTPGQYMGKTHPREARDREARERRTSSYRSRSPPRRYRSRSPPPRSYRQRSREDRGRYEHRRRDDSPPRRERRRSRS